MGVNGYQGIGELRKLKEISLQDILVDLLEGDQDLDLKTEINEPRDFAGVRVYEWVLKNEGYMGCSKTLKKYQKYYKRFMVSNKRLGRVEILKAISSLFDKETIRMTLSDKLMSNMSKK